MATLDATTDLLHLFGDPTRVRLLSLLSQHELTVAELVQVTGLPQSRVSTHLGRLREARVVHDRRDGASTFYSLHLASMPEGARKLWGLLSTEARDALLDADRARCEVVLRARRGAGFPDALAGEMERHYSPGRTWESSARAFAGLLRLGRVLDVGAGDGALAELLVPRASEVVLVDRSATMIEAARRRLSRFGNVSFVVGDMAEGGAPGEGFDQVLLLNVLTCTDRPAAMLRHSVQALRPGGELVAVVVAEHPDAELLASYGHTTPGLSPRELAAMLTDAGAAVRSCEITARERRPPHFEIITAFAERPSAGIAVQSYARRRKST